MAEEGGGGEDSGGGGTSISNTYVTVNGGQNSLGSADSVDVTTSITNITADNVTVYVEGDYNPTYLYYPRVSELHMVNNTNGALWNPTLDELPNTLHAAVMKQAKIALLYDGWVDLEHTGVTKPAGATREGEILGYDIYAKLGEKYTAVDEYADIDHASDPVTRARAYTYTNGGLFKETDAINLTWALIQLYRAVGVEQTQLYAVTEERSPETYDVNASPIAQFITMATKGVDLSAAMTYVYASRTDPDLYLSIAAKDCVAVAPTADRTSQHVTVGEFCVLAYTLMNLYGEPVLTDLEMQILLEAYGRVLPYGLSAVQLEAVKYLMAKGIVESDLDWNSDISFKDASTILMRIKDTGSRLTIKDVTLTTDVSLLSKGYYPTEVSTYQSPIEITDTFSGYDTYTHYDYFVDASADVVFKTKAGVYSIPFVCNGFDHSSGVLEGSEYMGRVLVKGLPYYHFRVPQSQMLEGPWYVNTTVASDLPARYALSAGEGGVWTYSGSKQDWGANDSVGEWVYETLDARGFPAEYLDATRKKAHQENYTAQTGLFSTALYGYAIRVHQDDLGEVSFEDINGELRTLEGLRPSSVTGDANTAKLNGGVTIIRNADNGRYAVFEVRGCLNENTLAEIFKCADGMSYQKFPAFAQQNNRYLVSVDYLKSIGVVWEFTKTSDSSYYLGVFSGQDDPVPGVSFESMYTDVYIGTSGTNSYVIRGSQLTLYNSDVSIIYEADTGYYVDYSAIVGTSRLVSFEGLDGAATLTRSGIKDVDFRAIANTNSSKLHTQTPASEWAATVTIRNSSNERMKYVYCPITYVLANWLVVENQIDGRIGVFSFFADADMNKDSEGVHLLASQLGVSTADASWSVSYKAADPLNKMSVTLKDGAYHLSESVKDEWPALLYIAEYNAYLVRPNILDPQTTYGEFVDMDTSALTTSLVSFTTESGIEYLGDWNYNLYKFPAMESYTADYVRHAVWTNGRDDIKWCDMSAYAGSSVQLDSDGEHGTEYQSTNYNDWIPAPAGIQGLLGYPFAMSQSLKNKTNVHIYSGSCYAIRGQKDGTVFASSNGEGDDSTQVLEYSLIHATPYKTWLQSCGFRFRFMEDSPLSPSVPTPTIDTGEGLTSFDWGQFFQDVGLQNADDWLTIAIIAVLNILPRIFMFAFVLLMGLALIANVKPWQLFCDSVFDPYKFLTLGRKDVHTIQLKMVFMYSIIALALFGLFQNGIILEVIAWVARAVTGILSR